MMKAVMLIAIGFVSGIAFTIILILGLAVLAVGREHRPPTKEEWKLR